MTWTRWPMAATAYEGVSLAWDAPFEGGHHAGTDFPLPIGTPIVAVGSGTISSTWDDAAAGLCIFLETDPSGETACYEHLSAILAATGTRVAAGDVIGRSGMTGNTTGPHLHLGYLRHPVWQGNSYGDNSDTDDPLRHLPGSAPATNTAGPQYLLTAVLQRGRGPATAVAAAQRVLATIGAKPYHGGDPVGVFGAATQDAVVHFQAGHGLKRDGKIGPATAAAMGWRWGSR